MPLDFEEIDLGRQKDFKSRRLHCLQVASDCSFINMWSWRDIYGLQWCWTDELVWVRQTRPVELMWPPLGRWGTIDWAKELKDNSPLNFIRVPEKLAFMWKEQLGESVRLYESRQHWDYVYSVRNLTRLESRQLKKKRDMLNEFKDKYEFSYEHLQENNIEEALGMQSDWCVWRDCESSETLMEENKAIINAFEDWNRLEGIFGAGLLVGGDMIAYTVGEELDEETALIHFEKACPDHVGAYQAINQLFLRNHCQRFRFVNREQDMGEDGLRKAKLSYYPSHFIKKYEVEIR